MKSTFLQEVSNNLIFVLQFLGLVAALFLVAYGAERIIRKKQGTTGKILTTRKMSMVGVFAAIATILMFFEIPLFFAPGFYKLDFSELPALIGTFAFGPVAGVMIEFCKIILKLAFRGTTTAFVGELANFVVGCSFLLPASILYEMRKSKKNAVLGCVVGTVIMTVFGTALNGIYLLPQFAKIYGMDMSALIGMGTAINPAIDSVTSLILLAVAPLNLLKGGSVSVITLLIYKKIRPILKGSER